MTETAAVQPPSTPDESHPFGKPPKDLPPFQPGPSTRVKERGSVRIEVVDLSKKADRRRFLDVVDGIYIGDANFIKPLDMERMKFLDTAHNASLAQLEIRPMIAYRGERAVGRLTVHIDRAYDSYHGTHMGWFGFFECTDDVQVAHAMFAEGLQWLKQKGATEVIGPMNFTTNHQIGLLVEGFDSPPMVEMTYNPPYYERLITSFGFAKAKDLYQWWIDIVNDPAGKRARITAISEKIKKRLGVTVRGADLKNFEKEVGIIFDLYNQSWQRNWGFVPVGREEFTNIAKDLKQVIDPDLVLFVENKGVPVAFAVTLPDVNQVMPRNGSLFPFGWYKLAFGMKKVKVGRLFTLGVVPAFRKRGVESMLFMETANRARDKGWPGGEIGWTLEDNDLINRAIESMDGKLHKRYRLFGLTV